MGIPPVHWLPWIPQLLMSLVRKEGQFVLNLLCHIGKTFPQVRTLFIGYSHYNAIYNLLF